MRRILPRILLLNLLLLLLSGCSQPALFTSAIDPADAAFLATHGWTVTDQLAVHTIQLPDRFADEPGAYPVGFYWAYNNELSRAAGLDFSRYAGQKVSARLYALQEPLDDTPPNREVRAVVLRHDGQLIGAYLDLINRIGFGTTLDRRTLGEVTGKEFGQWLADANVVNWQHPTYQALAGRPPADLIREYYAQLDRHDYQRAMTLTALWYRTWFLFANRQPTALYNSGFRNVGGGPTSVRRATVLQITGPVDRTVEPSGPTDWNRKPVRALQFGVSVDERPWIANGFHDGRNHYFFSVVQETPDAPFLINGIGTGP